MGFSTPRGTTPFPSLLYEGDAGSFGTYRNEVQLGGTYHKLDYYGAFRRLPRTTLRRRVPQHHIEPRTSATRSRQAPASASRRATPSPPDFPAPTRSTGCPTPASNPIRTSSFPHSIDNRPPRAGTVSSATDSRAKGKSRPDVRGRIPSFNPVGPLNYYGESVTITGANGYSVTGQALMNYGGVYPYTIDLVSNRDNLYAQTDYRITPHLNCIAGFRFEDERGAENDWVYDFSETLERTNYDYMLADERRLQAALLLLSSVEASRKTSSTATEGTPRIGLPVTIRIVPARVNSTERRINFNFAKGVKEPTIDDQFGSLYTFLLGNGGELPSSNTASPIGAEQSRSYDGGVEQSLFSERVLVRDLLSQRIRRSDRIRRAYLVPTLLPNLTPEQQQSLQASSRTPSRLRQFSGRSALRGSKAKWNTASVTSSFAAATPISTLSCSIHFRPTRLVRASTRPSGATIPIGAIIAVGWARVPSAGLRTPGFSASYTSKDASVTATGAFASRGDDSIPQRRRRAAATRCCCRTATSTTATPK